MWLRAARRCSVPVILLVLGIAAAGLAVALAPTHWVAASRFAWPPFVLVAGLFLVGVCAERDGVFTWAATYLARAPGSEAGHYASCVVTVAVTTVFLNLDTAVAFLTPVIIATARLRASSEERALYSVVFTANAASLLLPGSNLTNLLVLEHEHVTGAVFLARMAPAWLAAVAVTAFVVHAMTDHRRDEPAPIGDRQRLPVGAGLVATLAAALLVLLTANPALPVLIVGISAAGWEQLRQRMPAAALAEQLDLTSLLGLYGVAVAVGTLARSWGAPARLMGHAGVATTAAVAAIASVLLNNLPAAVLLSSEPVNHPRALLFGLNIGPNLAVTGSLSALLWWQAARRAGSKPSVLQYSKIGIVAAPLAITAAVLATALLARHHL
jgi:arsenical pump membrane protein